MFAGNNRQQLAWGALILVPITVLLLLHITGLGSYQVQGDLLHKGLIALANLFSLTVGLAAAYVFYRTGQWHQLALAAGALWFAAIYLWHGTLTGSDPPFRWLIYGPISRVMLAIALLTIGVPKQILPPKRPIWIAAILLVGVALLAVSGSLADSIGNWAAIQSRSTLQVTRIIIEVFGLILLLAALAIMVYRRNVIKWLIPAGLAILVYQAIFFLFAGPWNLTWWSAHALGSLGLAMITVGALITARPSDIAAELARLRLNTDRILEVAGEGIYGLDPEARVTFCNRRGMELLGLPPGDSLVGQRGHEFFHHTTSDDKPYPFDQCPVYDTLTTGATHTVDNEVFWRPDGTSFPVEYTSTPVHEGDVIAGAVVVFRDVSTERAYQRLIERSNQDLQNYAYVASHDLRAPLRHISTYADIILDEESDHLSEDGQKHLERILTSVQQMQAMVDGLLEYSRIQGRPLQLERINLVDLFHEAEQIFHDTILETGATISVDDLGEAWADRSHITNIFQNLLSNSLRYQRPDVPLVIHVSTERTPDLVTISFSDNGTGFDPNLGEKVFAMFQRLDPSRGEGSGLGLAICRRMVQAHGGDMWADAKPGEGSIFTFTLPEHPRHLQEESTHED